MRPVFFFKKLRQTYIKKTQKIKTTKSFLLLKFSFFMNNENLL